MSKKQPFRAYIPLLIGGIFLLTVIGVIVHYISGVASAPPKKERKIQAISLTKPPPPPPPPKVEKPSEPKEEKLREAKAEPKPDAPPKSDNNAKPESVGSGKGTMATDLSGGEVTRPMAGNGNGGNEANNKQRADFYGRQVVSELENLFADDEELLSLQFKLIVKLWFERDGSIRQVELVRGSNDAEIDTEVQRKLNKIKRFSDAPPEGVESPIKLEFAVGN